MAGNSYLNPKLYDGVPEVTPEELYPFLDKVLLIDVRRPEEFTGELAHIPGSSLITLGPDLENFLNNPDLHHKEIVFICRSGARSGRATLASRNMGFTKTVNLQGGMILWNEKNLPVEKEGK